jgi:hypothetical protein
VPRAWAGMAPEVALGGDRPGIYMADVRMVAICGGGCRVRVDFDKAGDETVSEDDTIIRVPITLRRDIHNEVRRFAVLFKISDEELISMVVRNFFKEIHIPPHWMDLSGDT